MQERQSSPPITFSIILYTLLLASHVLFLPPGGLSWTMSLGGFHCHILPAAND